MYFPRDWDKPSTENEGLCRLFGYGVFEDQGKLPYRIFEPETSEKVPLLVYLHGADAFGNDNEAQLAIHDIGTCFARPERQRKNPCFILAPQCTQKSRWSIRSSGGRLLKLISKLISGDERIDRERIYIYGYSAGAIGSLRLIKERPEIFAAAVSICGATERDKLEILEDIPLWLIHAADDEIVWASFNSGSSGSALLGSAEICDILKERAKDIRYTEYPPGFMKEKYGVNPHCTWVPAAEDEELVRWLFSRRKRSNARISSGSEGV